MAEHETEKTSITTFEQKPFAFSRIKKYKTEELLEYLTKDYCSWHYSIYTNLFTIEICDELYERNKINVLLNAFEMSKDPYQKEKITGVLYGMKDQEITAVFKKHLSSETTKTMYYCANYLARQGDTNALNILNDNYFDYPVSSWQWSYTVKLFGTYKYIPAVPNLIESRDAASLNVVEAAYTSLKQIFDEKYPECVDMEDQKMQLMKLYKATLANTCSK